MMENNSHYHTVEILNSSLPYLSRARKTKSLSLKSRVLATEKKKENKPLVFWKMKINLLLLCAKYCQKLNL